MGGQSLIAGAAALAMLAAPALAQSSGTSQLWHQCGGINYNGPTQCPSGSYCQAWNDWYHQCVPGEAPSTSSTSTSDTPTETSSSSATSSTSTSISISSAMTISPVVTTSSSSTTLVTSTRTTSTSIAPAPTSTDGCEIQYLITFGDSYSQTGFDITGTKPSPGNPLGNPPLPGWTASGGYNWVGFLTAEFNASTLLTYNYAYGGATTNASIVEPWRPDVLSFVDQVAQFSESIASHPEYAPWTSENALFGVWMGVNDVGNTWWKEDYEDIVERIMDSYFRQLQILYDAGARKFVLLGVPSIHRTPAMLGESAEVRAMELQAIKKYNTAIARRLEEFTAQNSGVTAKIVDTLGPFDTALDNPTAYGAPDNECYNSDGMSCLWFNDYHPGVLINRLVAKAVAEAWSGEFFV